MRNEFQFEILEDGKLSVKTGEFSDTKHYDADEFLAMIEEGIGGEVVREVNLDNAGKNFFKKRQVLRGGRIVRA